MKDGTLNDLAKTRSGGRGCLHLLANFVKTHGYHQARKTGEEGVANDDFFKKRAPNEKDGVGETREVPETLLRLFGDEKADTTYSYEQRRD